MTSMLRFAWLFVTCIRWLEAWRFWLTAFVNQQKRDKMLINASQVGESYCTVLYSSEAANFVLTRYEEEAPS